MLAYPDALNKILDWSRDVPAESCRHHMMELAVGTFFYIKDHDDSFPPKASTYKAALMPYVKEEAFFQCPGNESKEASYSFNKYLEGKDWRRIANLEKVVMLYEGKDQQLVYRHGKETMVAFANCETLTRAAAHRPGCIKCGKKGFAGAEE